MRDLHSTALVLDCSGEVAVTLGSFIRLAVGTEVEFATSFAGLQRLLAENPQRFYVAAIDYQAPDAAAGAAVDLVLGLGIPVVVLVNEPDDQTRDTLLDRNVLDYVERSRGSELEYLGNTIHRVYNNRFVKVLVVDDSDADRSYLRTLLQAHHYQTLEAEGGPTALQLLDQHPDVRLVISDYRMPGMDGVQLMREIRRRHARSELAVLGISEVGDPKLPARLLKCGANDFIAKPVVVDEFYCRVKQSIDTVEHIRLVEESATRDYLTRAYNRRYLFEAGARLHETARRGNLTLVAAMIDADHFKRINDAHGHHVGDLVLKEIAATLWSCLRQSDLVARYGGEEFCVLATGLDGAGARQVFDRVRREIAELRLPVGDATVQTTVSIGVALTLEGSLEAMINKADAAMYAAKGDGRNRIVVSV